MPRESFRAFSKIVCGHPDVGGERIPSLNWYEDNDIKSFLGKNGTEDTDMDHDNSTSKGYLAFGSFSLWKYIVIIFVHFFMQIHSAKV